MKKSKKVATPAEKFAIVDSIPFDPHACFRALSAAYDHLETAIGALPMEGDRKTIYVAKANIGSLMVGLLDFMIEDDRDDAGIDGLEARS